MLHASKKSFFDRFILKPGRTELSGTAARPIQKFVKRVASISAAFFIISSFSVFDYYFEVPAQGYGYETDALPVEDVTNQNISEILANVNQTDGFMIKSNKTTTAGDRSTSHEILSYKVEAGDTVASIAAHYQIKEATVMMENNFYDVNQLKPGATISVLPVDGITHLVQKGDTLSGIAKKYNVAVDDIVRQNQLEGEALLPNARLVIPGATKTVLPPKPAYVPGVKSSKKSGIQSSPSPSFPDYVYAGAASAGLIFPVPNGGILTQPFHSGHLAIDFANRGGGPIIAATSGKVIKASYGWNGGYGNEIIIDDGNGMQTLYGHNKVLYVSEGDTVKQGDHISDMGNTGNVRGVTGIHLHFEVRIKGVKYNPMQFFNK